MRSMAVAKNKVDKCIDRFQRQKNAAENELMIALRNEDRDEAIRQEAKMEAWDDVLCFLKGARK